MSLARQAETLALLRDLRTRSPEFEAVALVSVEGVVLASCLGEETDDKQLAAMSAALLGFGDRISRELGRGALDHAVLQGRAGFTLLMTLDEIRVLIAVLRDEANMGLALLDMRRAVKRLLALDAEAELKTEARS